MTKFVGGSEGENSMMMVVVPGPTCLFLWGIHARCLGSGLLFSLLSTPAGVWHSIG